MQKVYTEQPLTDLTAHAHVSTSIN